MKQEIIFGLLSALSLPVWAQVKDTTTVYLKEVMVASSNIVRKEDRLVITPTDVQRKHASSGYDLLDRLLIPGVDIDRRRGKVNVAAGTVNLYINGREVTYREVQSLRPKEVKTVEYIDMPTGKYARDVAAISFILKEKETGGYTQLDGRQTLGYLSGDNNIVSKYTLGATNLNLWTGYQIDNPKSTFSGNERFLFPNSVINRTTHYQNATQKNINKYVQASISNRGKKAIWMIRAGLSCQDNFYNQNNGNVHYSEGEDSGLTLKENSNSKTIMPALYLYNSWRFNQKHYLELVFDSYYSGKDYSRNHQEEQMSYLSDIKEDYYYLKFNSNYIITLRHKNTLAFSFYEFLRLSHTAYGGTPAYKQQLRSSETILFMDYSQRLGALMFHLNPGVSYLNYRLRGDDAIVHVTPRLQLSASYRLTPRQLLRLDMALGNSYLSLNTINHVDQQIAPLIIRRGNAGMDNSVLLWPRLSYTLILNKLSVNAMLMYTYYSHAIADDYYMEKGFLIHSFRSDVRYQSPSFSISTTYKPASYFDVKVGGQWQKQIAQGAIFKETNAWSASAKMNYYIKDFAFSASCSTPRKSLENYQIDTKTNWLYELTVAWNHGNIGVELSANNLFIRKNRIDETLWSAVYQFQRTRTSEDLKSYASVKITYSLDYGKKTSKSPAYKQVKSESATLL